MRPFLLSAALAVLCPLTALAQEPAEPKPRQVKAVPALRPDVARAAQDAHEPDSHREEDGSRSRQKELTHRQTP